MRAATVHTPYCTVLAGPNGAGKSSVYPLLRLLGAMVNTDDFARGLDPSHPESVSLAAGKLVVRRRRGQKAICRLHVDVWEMTNPARLGATLAAVYEAMLSAAQGSARSI